MVKFNEKDIPDDVWTVWIIKHINQPIGSKLMEYCQEVINKYPKYFETKK